MAGGAQLLGETSKMPGGDNASGRDLAAKRAFFVAALPMIQLLAESTFEDFI